MKRLRLLEWITLATAFAFTIDNWFDVIPIRAPTRLLLLFFGLTLAFLALIGVGRAVVKWRSEQWRTLLLPTIALSGFVIAFVVGTLSLRYRDREFLAALPRYQRVVDRFLSGGFPQGVLPLDSLPAELGGCCYRVEGMKAATGEWRVEFWVGYRFPVHHEAWMYYDGPSVRPAMRAGEWYSEYRLSRNWYRVAD